MNSRQLQATDFHYLLYLDLVNLRQASFQMQHLAETEGIVCKFKRSHIGTLRREILEPRKEDQQRTDDGSASNEETAQLRLDLQDCKQQLAELMTSVQELNEFQPI